MERCFCDILDILFIRQEKFKAETANGPMISLGLELHSYKYSVMATPVYILQSGKSGGRYPLPWTPTASTQDAHLLLLYTPHRTSDNSPGVSTPISHKSSETSVGYWNQCSLFGQLMLLFSFLPGWFFLPCQVRYRQNTATLLVLPIDLLPNLSAGCGIWKSNMPSTLKKVKFQKQQLLLLL